MRRASLLAALALGVLASAGCGGGATTAQNVVADTQDKLASVTSANLRLRLELDSTLGRNAQVSGFQLQGPLSLAKQDGPLADIRYWRLSRSAAATPTAEIVVDRASGRVEIGSGTKRTSTPLSAAQIAQLRASVGGSPGNNGLFSRLHLKDWVRSPTLVRTAGIDTVRGEVDLAAAARDLLAIARASGQTIPELSDSDLQRLDKLTTQSRFELATRHADSVLRRLRIDFTLAPQGRAKLGSVVVASGHFSLVLQRVNKPVHLRRMP